MRDQKDKDRIFSVNQWHLSFMLYTEEHFQWNDVHCTQTGED